jgi:hypothetical protein
MKKLLIGLVIVMVLLSACGGGATPVPTAMTVTAEGSECTYSGPTTVTAGTITVNWNIAGQNHDKYGLAIVTLNDDKTFEDLDAWPSVDKPPWAELLIFREKSSEGHTTVETDVTKGPLFMVCFTAYPEKKVEVLGPVDVEG